MLEWSSSGVSLTIVPAVLIIIYRWIDALLEGRNLARTRQRAT